METTVKTLRSSAARTPDRSLAMKARYALAVALLALVPATMTAQDDTGKVFGGYQVNQSVEFGGRIADTNGNGDVYNTFVNLHSGPRLLDYTLNMRSIGHAGVLFDDLYFSNFGYGGDPSNVSRLRLSKNQWYDFQATFRRDVNYFNFNSLVNPLNYGPTVANPTAPTVVSWNDSIHTYNTRRRMGDFALTIAPQSAVRVRLGFSRGDNQGPTWSSYHEGTDVQLFQDWSNREDQYRVGVDLRVAPRTTVSFDQFYTYGKVNTTAADTLVGNYFINTGTVAAPNLQPVDIGAIYNPYYNQPCANVSVGAGGVVTPATCGIYGYYSRTQPWKTSGPTSQLTLSSNYWKKLDITATGSYSSIESKMDNFFEQARTYVTRTNELAYTFSGPTRAKRINSHADVGFTYHINEAFSVVNQTRWINYRIPGVWNANEEACFPAAGVTPVTVWSPLGSNGTATCAGFATAAAAPVHAAGSGADFATINYRRYLGEETVYNTSLLQWEPMRQFGAHIGYRWGSRDLTMKNFDDETATYLGPAVGARPVGVVTTPAEDEIFGEHITSHSFLVGLKARPVDDWNITADAEILSADNVFEPISPQHEQRVKLRSTYRVAKWGTISGSLNVRENRNSYTPKNPDGTEAIPSGYVNPRHQDHSRAYNAAFTLNPVEWFATDIGYTYNDIYSQSGACLYVSGGAAGLIPEGGQIRRCQTVNHPYNPADAPDAAIPSILDYAESIHNGYVNFRVTPVKRVTFTIGYDIVSNGGKNQWLRADTLAPLRVPVDQVGNVIITSTTVGGVLVPNPVNGQVLAGYAYGPNPFAPFAQLQSNWHKPNGSVEVQLTKTVTFKGAYNYYDYNEKTGANTAALAARDFRANVGTLSLKYAF